MKIFISILRLIVGYFFIFMFLDGLTTRIELNQHINEANLLALTFILGAGVFNISQSFSSNN